MLRSCIKYFCHTFSMSLLVSHLQRRLEQQERKPGHNTQSGNTSRRKLDVFSFTTADEESLQVTKYFDDKKFLCICMTTDLFGKFRGVFYAVHLLCRCFFYFKLQCTRSYLYCTRHIQ